MRRLHGIQGGGCTEEVALNKLYIIGGIRVIFAILIQPHNKSALYEIFDAIYMVSVKVTIW